MDVPEQFDPVNLSENIYQATKYWVDTQDAPANFDLVEHKCSTIKTDSMKSSLSVKVHGMNENYIIRQNEYFDCDSSTESTGVQKSTRQLNKREMLETKYHSSDSVDTATYILQNKPKGTRRKYKRIQFNNFRKSTKEKECCKKKLSISRTKYNAKVTCSSSTSDDSQTLRNNIIQIPSQDIIIHDEPVNTDSTIPHSVNSSHIFRSKIKMNILGNSIENEDTSQKEIDETTLCSKSTTIIQNYRYIDILENALDVTDIAAVGENIENLLIKTNCLGKRFIKILTPKDVAEYLTGKDQIIHKVLDTDSDSTEYFDTVYEHVASFKCTTIDNLLPNIDMQELKTLREVISAIKEDKMKVSQNKSKFIDVLDIARDVSNMKTPRDAFSKNLKIDFDSTHKRKISILTKQAVKRHLKKGIHINLNYDESDVEPLRLLIHKQY